MTSGRSPADVVLVGGGHAHVEVLRRWIRTPPRGARLTVVLDRPEAVYSGMVPGFVAGDYAAARDLEIDVASLARRAGARVMLASAVGIDPGARRLDLDAGPALAWDVASLDVGATVRGLDLPGVREHALVTRPIRTFVDRVGARLAEVAVRGGGGVRVAVVGAGAAGIELSFTLGARLRALGREPHVTVFSGGTVLPGHPRRVARRALREAARHGITIASDGHVVAVEPDAVVLRSARVPCDLVVWATGAAPLPFPGGSPLPIDARGFVRVRRTLQAVGHDDLFAAGDCAALEDAPWVRKAGVYAVRQGPSLAANLRARVTGRALHPHRPPRHVLSLLNLGRRQALATKWGAVAVGGWAWRWKNMIDRRFVRRLRAGDLPRS